MGMHFRIGLCLALAAELCGAAFGQNACGPFDGNWNDPDHTEGTFSIPVTNAAECTDGLIIYGTTIGGYGATIVEYNPCTDQTTDLVHASGPKATFQQVLTMKCGQAWATLNHISSSSSASRPNLAPRTTATPQPAAGQAALPLLVADVNGDGIPDTLFLARTVLRLRSVPRTAPLFPRSHIHWDSGPPE